MTDIQAIYNAGERAGVTAEPTDTYTPAPPPYPRDSDEAIIWALGYRHGLALALLRELKLVSPEGRVLQLMQMMLNEDRT